MDRDAPLAAPPNEPLANEWARLPPHELYCAGCYYCGEMRQMMERQGGDWAKHRRRLAVAWGTKATL